MTQWNREPWGRYSSTSRRRPDAPGPQRDRRSLAACSTRTGTKARTRPASRRLCSSWTTSSMCSRGRAGNFTESRSTTSLSARNSSFTPIGKVPGFRPRPSRFDQAAAAEWAARREHTTPAGSSRAHPRNTAQADAPAEGSVVVSAGGTCGAWDGGCVPADVTLRRRPDGTQSAASPSGAHAVRAGVPSVRGGRWRTG